MSKINVDLKCAVSAESTIADLQNLMSGNWNEKLFGIAQQCLNTCKSHMDSWSMPQTPVVGQTVTVNYPNDTAPPYTTTVQKVDIVDGVMRVYVTCPFDNLYYINMIKSGWVPMQSDQEFPSSLYFTNFTWDVTGNLSVNYDDKHCDDTRSASQESETAQESETPQESETRAGENVILIYPNSTIAPYTAIVQKFEMVDGVTRLYVDFGPNSPYFTKFTRDETGTLNVDYNDRQFDKVYVAPQGALVSVTDLAAIVGRTVVIYYGGDLQNQALTTSKVRSVDVAGSLQCNDGGAGMPKVEIDYSGNGTWFGMDAIKVDDQGKVFLEYDIQRFGAKLFTSPVDSVEIPTDIVNVGSEVCVYYGGASTVAPATFPVMATTPFRVTLSYGGSPLHFTTVYRAPEGEMWVNYDAREYDKVFVPPKGELGPVTDMNILADKQVFVYYGGDVTDQVTERVMSLDLDGKIRGQNGGEGVSKVEVSYSGDGMWFGLSAFKVDGTGKVYLHYDSPERYGRRLY